MTQILENSQDAIQQLLEMWKKDSVFDRTDPGGELTKIGSLHSKYLTILSMNRQSLVALNKRGAKLRKLKWEYYTGKLDEATLRNYGWQAFPYVLKSDVSIYMESDKDLLALQEMKSVHEELVELCTSIIKELNSRTFQAKDIITWERFIQGVN